MSTVSQPAPVSGTAETLLEVRGVSVEYGPVQALVGVDLVVPEGEWLAVEGPSGSGKSTLLQLMAGLDLPTRGQILYQGTDISRMRHLDGYRRNDVGLVFQLHNLLPHLDILGNVEIAMLGTGRHKRARYERATELLERLHLNAQADRKPPALSGGERQRVAIARALANDPPLILADEPTGSLDPRSIDAVMELFTRLHRAEGRTIVMVTHDRAVAGLADRVVHLADGRITNRRERERTDSPVC